MKDTQATSPAGTATEMQSDALLESAGQALFQLGRVISHQPVRQLLAARTGRASELSRILVVQAVELSVREGEVSVGAVAARLGVDPSTASRLVGEAIQAGYLARAASPADARRAQLALTDAGHALAADARRYQRSVFEHATQNWSERERREFARLFVKFADAVAEIRDAQR
jgi:DNA-binding MarR family transcriptional regulator